MHDGRVAVVVDPQRDIDRVERLLADVGATLDLVVEPCSESVQVVILFLRCCVRTFLELMFVHYRSS
ncbi:hypothetical protein [Actinacidiphila soli]|uniref:hypothetical protein n=1 Tax=Actinacidiphila soli TaxID=2487275 RepID=UPI000FCB5EB4|nr:hypothetical protein [Actinacidiphila soli]